MIISKLKGSLGNQLFQYSFARSIQLTLGHTLFLDKSSIYKYKAQSYFSLDKYWVNAITLPFDSKYLTSAFRRLGLSTLSLHSDDTNSLYDADSFNGLSKNYRIIILNGYWQSYKYFEKFWPILRNELQLKKVAFSEEQRATLQSMSNSEAVSVHIRRGDYLKSSDHHKLGLEYYHRSIELIRRRVKNPLFIFFSDDMNWVKKMFTGNDYLFPEQNISSPQNDLYLMSNAKHNIIANSTFSWWSGWMNSHKDKIVIAPDKWFTDLKRNKYLDDLIPSDWIRI